MSRIFISHSSDDREQSARLLAWLHSQGFVSTFLDFDKGHGIQLGADWERTLYRELSSADAVILVLTRNWFGSKWCFAEFAQARALGKAIFPVIESPAGETFVASDIQHLDLIGDREGGLHHLLSQLTRIALDTRGGFPWDATRPPYPGLLAFDEADAAIYFGRDDEIRRLIERLNARRAQGGEKLVLVLGASGSGKSSLLRAGVVPRLKRDPHNWIVLPPFRPQLHPLDELAQVVAVGLGQASEWRRWRDALAGGELTHPLSDLARDLRAAQNQTEAQILLVIDQGEELFAGSDPDQTDQFFRVLCGLLDERLPFLVAMSLRSDYLGRLQQEPRLQALFEQFSLKPMPLERVRQIIEGPAKVAAVAVEDGLVRAAIADAQTEDALPLLAFTLRELYDRFASSGRLTAEAYGALSDPTAQLSPLENAVRRKADEVMAAAKPAPEDLNALKEAFIPAMVRVNPEGEYVRRPAPIESISPRALPLIERLAKARLLTILDERGVRTVEVAHEALLRKWPLLRAWLDDEREFLIGKNQLEQDLHDWERAAPEQKPDALLTGLKLTRARIWLLAKPHQLTAREREFIQASVARREAEAAQRERRRQVAIWVLSLLLVTAATFAWLANREKNAADQNLKLAMTAVDVSLSTASAQQSQEAPGSPETEELRAQLQQKAQTFYQGLLKQTPDNEEARRNMAMAHLRLGDIDRLSEKFQDAVSEYNQAINQFEKLSQAHPTNLDYPQNLGYCHNWLGETYRAWRKLNQEPAQETAADVQKEYEQAVTIQEAFLQAEAQNEYDLAIAIQQDLHQNQPAIPDYQQDLARSFYNRGNLLNESQVDPRPDYQQAINLLKPIAGAGHSTPEQTTVSPEPPPEQELARVDTDLGIYLDEKELYTQAVESHEQAIQIVNALRQNEPANYEYKMEAANYYFNLACVLGDEHQFEQAKTASDTARHLFNELAAPSQALEDLRTKNDRLIDWIDKNNHGSAKSAPGK